jgi:hypothetical protein
LARIQVFQGGNIQRDAPQVAPIRPQQFETGAVGEGIQQFGQGVGEAASMLDKINAAHDEAAAKEATNAVSQHFLEIGYTGANPYFDKQGKDALDLRPTVDKSLDSFIQQARANLKNQRQQTLFDDAVIPQRQAWGQSIAAHALKETRTYAVGESAARAGMTGELARYTYFDNPEEGEKQLDTQDAEIASVGHLKGMSDDEIKLEQLKARSGAYKDIGVQLANDGGGQAQELISAFIDKHGASMTGDDRTALTSYGRVRQDAYDAEQRRIEADQRRAANEAKHDAHDRATTAAQNIDLGIPMKPEEYTSALSDAQASGDENLVKRIQVGQFKNNLTIQYRNATPADLQNRINALSAQIAKAGADAKPDWVVERDHLQTLYNGTASKIRTDRLSWGAQTQGIDVQPVNFADQGSVNARIQAASQAASRSGMPPQVFTNAEAAQISPQVSGTVQQKQALVANLAKFGPLALSAAQQVAPNDAGFQNLVGLATHPNHSVAAFRVNQVLTGQEVLKTKPKLVDRTQSAQQFQQYVGDALHFFPGTSSGVYQNATAILASHANDRGWNEWSDIDGNAWNAAINSALGAYIKDGKQYGGLAAFNGGQTVLPDDMDSGTFETKISRASGPQFIAASGRHTPVLADGSHPTASQIKKMRWVPSGDGIYRLTDGSGFVKTTDGGFYEINVRKLP